MSGAGGKATGFQRGQYWTVRKAGLAKGWKGSGKKGMPTADDIKAWARKLGITPP